MNKRVFGRKLSRSRPSREALFASLARSIILNGKIITTRAKAKAVQGDVESFVTTAKKGGLSGMRKVLASLDNARDAVDFLYQNVVPAFAKKTSGYTRIISLPPRKGDNAKMVRIEWTEKVDMKKVERPVSKETTARKAKRAEKKAKKTESKKEVKKAK